MKEIELNWSEFKRICITKKKLNVQFTIENDSYNVFAVEKYIFWHVNLVGEDMKEFDKKYKKNANKRIEDQ